MFTPCKRKLARCELSNLSNQSQKPFQFCGRPRHRIPKHRNTRYGEMAMGVTCSNCGEHFDDCKCKNGGWPEPPSDPFEELKRKVEQLERRVKELEMSQQL
jgi:hypothetical protein